MRYAVVPIFTLVLPLLAGCSHQSRPIEPDGAKVAPDVAASGLEATTFVCGLDEHALAKALAASVDQPLPIPQAMAELWSAHGFRIVAVPTESADALMASLKGGGGGSWGGGGLQKQWLGQAYSWTEVVRGGDTSSKVVALDAERIRLPAGSLRLLARSWLEPAPPKAGDISATAMLHVELVPQNQEARRPEETTDPLALRNPNIEPEAQGLLFSRLYASMSLAPGQSLMVIPDRPEADWKKLAEEPAPTPPPAPAQASANGGTAPSKPQGAPRIGEVVRGTPHGGAGGGAGDVSSEATVEGPSGPRILTLGEAILGSSGGRGGPGSSRTVLLLTPRVPKEFRLLPSMPSAPATASAGPAPRG
jgi:hypothetical protein